MLNQGKPANRDVRGHGPTKRKVKKAGAKKSRSEKRQIRLGKVSSIETLKSKKMGGGIKKERYLDFIQTSAKPTGNSGDF